MFAFHLFIGSWHSSAMKCTVCSDCVLSMKLVTLQKGTYNISFEMSADVLTKSRVGKGMEKPKKKKPNYCASWRRVSFNIELCTVSCGRKRDAVDWVEQKVSSSSYHDGSTTVHLCTEQENNYNNNKNGVDDDNSISRCNSNNNVNNSEFININCNLAPPPPPPHHHPSNAVHSVSDQLKMAIANVSSVVLLVQVTKWSWRRRKWHRRPSRRGENKSSKRINHIGFSRSATQVTLAHRIH